MNIKQEEIIEHYKNPNNFYKLDNYTHTYKAVNYSCGDEIEVFLIVKNKKIVKISFIGSGCSISIATASILSDYLVNKYVHNVLLLNVEDVVSLLGIDITVSRRKCAYLPLFAIQQALKKKSGVNIT
ncbi:MAG: iron-sulfur cluster assembly scaffold protein [Candidatus Dojkabacteria bacterium]|nr:iron-sulfur cluster assembly scaffold protein [Candidatus Dojkabacteria bacterium]